jgi:lysophospholipase L1-like esterase
MSIAIAGKRVLIYGDSQAQGWGPHVKRALLERGAREVATSVQAGLSLAGALSDRPPPERSFDVAIVSLGGNNPPSTYDRASELLARALNAIDADEIIWVTVTPSLDPAQQVARARMAAFQVEFLTSQGVRVVSGDTLYSGLPHRDNVHLTAAGYEGAAKRLVANVVLPRHSGAISVVAGALIGAIAAYVTTRRRR